MSTDSYIAASAAVAIACVLIVAAIGFHQTRVNRLPAPQPIQEETPMALIDFRVLVDYLRTRTGESAFATIETIAPDRIELGIVIGSDPTVTLNLAEGEAGAIFDGLGGALRALAVTPATPEDPRIAKLRVLAASPRPWSEDDADSCEARSARAYNFALASVALILTGGAA